MEDCLHLQTQVQMSQLLMAWEKQSKQPSASLQSLTQLHDVVYSSDDHWWEPAQWQQQPEITMTMSIIIIICCDPINLKPGLFYFAFFDDAVWMWSSWVTKATGAAACKRPTCNMSAILIHNACLWGITRTHCPSFTTSRPLTSSWSRIVKSPPSMCGLSPSTCSVLSERWYKFARSIPSASVLKTSKWLGLTPNSEIKRSSISIARFQKATLHSLKVALPDQEILRNFSSPHVNHISPPSHIWRGSSRVAIEEEKNSLPELSRAGVREECLRIVSHHSFIPCFYLEKFQWSWILPHLVASHPCHWWSFSFLLSFHRKRKNTQHLCPVSLDKLLWNSMIQGLKDPPFLAGSCKYCSSLGLRRSLKTGSSYSSQVNDGDCQWWWVQRTHAQFWRWWSHCLWNKALVWQLWSAGRGGYVFAIQWKLTRSCKQWCTQRKHSNSVVFDRATKKERCSNLTNPQKQQQENQTFKLLHALRESCLMDFLRRIVKKKLLGTKKNTCDQIEHQLQAQPPNQYSSTIR